jgi:general secretion pathway protein L
MPEKILGLDISENSVTAVQVESGLKGYHILACARVAIGADDNPDDAMKGIIDQMGLDSDTCIASLPGEHASYRNLKMPFKELKKIRQTLPFEIEAMVPLPIDELLIDFTVVDHSDRNEILAVSVEKTFVSDYLARLRPHGIDPDFLDVRSVPVVSWLLGQGGIPDNGLFLEIGDKRVTMVLYVGRRITLIRTFAFDGKPLADSIFNPSDGNGGDASESGQIESYFQSLCTMVQNTTHAFESRSNRAVRPERIFFTGMGALYSETATLLNRFLEIPAEQIDMKRDKRVSMDGNIARVWNPALMDNALALALRDTKRGQGFNFRRDEFEVKRQYLGLKKEIRRAVIFLVLIISFVAVDLGVDQYFLKERYRMLDKKIEGVFSGVLPDVTKIVDPIQQMKVKINELKKTALSHPGMKTSNKVIDLLKDISERIPQSMDVHLTRMVIDPETVRISGDTDTFNTVDSIKNGLEPSIYFSSVTISSANLDRTGKRIQFEMKLQRSQ